MNIYSLLVLIRPANGLTAISDILAGAAIGNFIIDGSMSKIILLIIATFCLYSSGIIFNDVFDRDIDKVERPERPIPSGKITTPFAVLFGIILTIIGVGCCFFTNLICGFIGTLIALSALLYNKFSKHHPIVGPMNMGLCRSLNLLLGISIIGQPQFLICLLPFLFIFGITLTSRGEVNGNNKWAIQIALFIDVLIAASIVYLSTNKETYIWVIVTFLGLWFGLNLKAKMRAIINNNPKAIQHAVKTGVISLIPLNAVYAAVFSGWQTGLVVLTLLPISIQLSKRFSVT